MEFAEYLEQIPNLHYWEGAWNSGGFGKEHLAPLHRFLVDHAATKIAETGAGNSTITFLFSRPRQVLSIAPSAELFGRIESFCTSSGIPLDPLRKVVGYSQWELPRLAGELEQQLDFVLIDGCHGWPTVFVDFFYMTHMVKLGGHIMIDDVHLHSVSELVSFLREQPNFEFVMDLGKAVIFKRIAFGPQFTEWHVQPYIARMTRRRSRWISGLRRRLKI